MASSPISPLTARLGNENKGLLKFIISHDGKSLKQDTLK